MSGEDAGVTLAARDTRQLLSSSDAAMGPAALGQAEGAACNQSIQAAKVTGQGAGGRF